VLTCVAVSPLVSAGRSRSRRGLVVLQSTNSSMPPLYFQLSSTLRMTRMPYRLACRVWTPQIYAAAPGHLTPVLRCLSRSECNVGADVDAHDSGNSHNRGRRGSAHALVS